MATSAEQIRKIDELRRKLLEYRSVYEGVWADIITYLAPTYASVKSIKPGSESAPGFKQIYDTTAIEASNVMADGLQGYAFGRTISWFRLELEDTSLMSSQANKEWMQAAERHLYSQFNKSNFYDESRAAIRTGADFGTAIMVMDHDVARGVPVFHTLHPGSFVIEEDRHGTVSVLIRSLWLTKHDAEQQFGKDSLPDEIKGSTDNTEQYEFFQYIAKASRIEVDTPGTEEWVSIYWSALSAERVVHEERFNHKPFFAWRWAKNPAGSPWGSDNPGMVQIPNIKMLQSLTQDYIRISQLTARPPLKKTRGLRVNFTPSGFTEIDPGSDFAPVQVTADLSWTVSIIERMRRQIDSAYHKDFFLALLTSQDRTKTATEVQALVDEKSAIMSSFFSRLAYEFIEPVLEALFDLEVESIRLPAPPPEIAQNKLNIDFVSPLAMLQKRSHGLNTTKQFLAEVISIAEVGPEIMDTIDLDGFVRVAQEACDVDERITRTEDDVTKIREARAQMQAQLAERQMQLEEAKAGAAVYKDTSKGPEEGSPASQSTRALAEAGGRR